MASLGGKHQYIFQILGELRKKSSSASSPLCVPTFRAYLDMVSMNVNQTEYKRFVKFLDESDDDNNASLCLSGLQRASAQLHRYQYPPLSQQALQNFQQQDVNDAAAKGHSYFLERVVPFLLDRALEFPQLFPEGKLPLACFNPRNVHGREETKIELTRHQILSVHALCFLGCDPNFGTPRHDLGNLSWFSLFMSGSSRVGVERILCQLMYFEYWRDRFEKLSKEQEHQQQDNNRGGPQLNEKVTFIRVAFPEIEALQKAATNNTDDDSSTSSHQHQHQPRNNKNQALPNWSDPASLDHIPLLARPPASAARDQYGSAITSSGIHIDGKFMEDFSEANVHVDFANKQLMIGRLIPSMTQEEVMFSVRPELLLSLLLFDTMREREAIIMRDAVTYTNYRGYRDTFVANAFVPYLLPAGNDSITEPVSWKTAPEVIAIDAHVNYSGGRDQFKAQMNHRDLDKIFIGFSSTITNGSSNVCNNNINNNKGSVNKNDDVDGDDATKALSGGFAEGDRVGTGPFGCGAFGGDSGLKFLQQLMGAACCQPRRYLCYYERAPIPYRLAAQLMLHKNVSVGAAYRWIDEYSKLQGESRTQTSSDAAPPIQLSNGNNNNNNNLLHHNQQDSAQIDVQEIENQANVMLANGQIQRNTFMSFLIKKLVA